jgi:DNA polymerase-3 subunit alpha
VVESFIKGGCFDSLDLRRASLFACIDRAMESGQKRQRDREQGQGSLFGLGAEEESHSALERVPDAPEWSEGERLANEKESLGFYISGHPLERFREELAQWATASTADLLRLEEPREVSIGGIITALRLLKTRKGDRMASFVLEDTGGGVEALVFPETYKAIAGRLGEDELVLVKGKAEVVDDGKGRILVSSLLPLEEAKLAEARFVTIRVSVPAWDKATGDRLRELLGSHRGDCPVTLELVRPGSYAVAVAASSIYRVRPDAGLKDEVEGLLGPGSLILARSNGASRGL